MGTLRLRPNRDAPPTPERLENALAARVANRTRFRPMAHPVTTDVDYGPEELDLLRALETYRQATHKRFLLARDYLYVFRELGYRKVTECPSPP